MKRIGNLLDKICDYDNMELADDRARRGKHNYGIQKHDKNRKFENEMLSIQIQLGLYKTSEYSTFKIYEPKERTIFRLPYFPDRVTHWAIMNVLEPIWTKTFIAHTYSCIKGRGIHKCASDVKKALKNPDTQYCLKLDIKKFYPSINHDILKQIIRKKIKDKQLLELLDEIIDSADGVPIGNYLSQFLANLYLTYFDHWLLEQVKVKYYFRYADDIVILSDDKNKLHDYLEQIRQYLTDNLKLEIKSNYQIFPVESRGIDFVGYVFYHDHVLLRKDIKKRLLRYIRKHKYLISSYFGWLKYCDSKHLLQSIEKLTGQHISNFNGQRKNVGWLKGKNVKVIEIDHRSKYFYINLIYKGKPYQIKRQHENTKTN